MQNLMIISLVRNWILVWILRNLKMSLCWHQRSICFRWQILNGHLLVLTLNDFLDCFLLLICAMSSPSQQTFLKMLMYLHCNKTSVRAAYLCVPPFLSYIIFIIFIQINVFENKIKRKLQKCSLCFLIFSCLLQDCNLFQVWSLFQDFILILVLFQGSMDQKLIWNLEIRTEVGNSYNFGLKAVKVRKLGTIF